MNVEIVSGTGNTFALVDAFDSGPLADPAALATAMVRASGRAVAGAPEAPADGRFELDAPLSALDGLLVLERSDRADVRMTLYNADGSRPETCGNGLRAVAIAAREHGRVARTCLSIECDAGVREAELLGGDPPRVRVSMGTPRVLEARASLATSRGTLDATLVDVGNPHCVLFVPDLDGAPVATLGPELERHPRFPARTNVEFVAVAPGRMRLRVWERGVGETAACGSGACAAAAAYWSTGRGDVPPEIELAGGVLGVEWDGIGEIRILGEVRTLARGAWREDATFVVVPHAGPRAETRARLLSLAARHAVRVEADDGTARGVLAKTLPFLGRAAVSFEIGERTVSFQLLERPQGLPEDLVKRALTEELARALQG